MIMELLVLFHRDSFARNYYILSIENELAAIAMFLFFFCDPENQWRTPNGLHIRKKSIDNFI